MRPVKHTNPRPIRRSRPPVGEQPGRRTRSAVPPVRPALNSTADAQPARRTRREHRTRQSVIDARQYSINPGPSPAGRLTRSPRAGLSGRLLALLSRHELAVHTVEASSGPQEQRGKEQPRSGAEPSVEPVSHVHENQDGQGELQPHSCELGARRPVLRTIPTGRSGGRSPTRRLTRVGGI